MQHESLAYIEADAVQMEQVSINLLRNSIEAYSGGHADRKRIEISTGQQLKSIVVGVTDFSGGISPEQQEGLFEPH